MKKNIKAIIILSLIISFSACGTVVNPLKNNENEKVIVSAEQNHDSEKKVEKPNLAQIRSICKLATLECYYHNVAKSEKLPGSGLFHKGEKSRKFWTEYTGVVKLGVDMSRGNMDIEGTDITIYIPDAEILSIKADSESVKEPIADPDQVIQRNPIGGEDVTNAINQAEEDIIARIESNSSLLVSAQDRAKKLIENYINRLGEATGVKYNITWVEVHNSNLQEEH